MNVDGVRKVFAQGLSANTDATMTFDLSGIKAERFEGYVGIDYTKSTKTNRDGANFIFYKDSIRRKQTGRERCDPSAGQCKTYEC